MSRHQSIRSAASNFDQIFELSNSSGSSKVDRYYVLRNRALTMDHAVQVDVIHVKYFS